jgi:hypothetical protein
MNQNLINEVNNETTASKAGTSGHKKAADASRETPGKTPTGSSYSTEEASGDT